ncbi:MAG: acyl-phosphate glycerol 3-phosphate acyltransferase [Rhodobacterales bacterium]|nr:MAG: acyl-phosphate glycerol 3-phosphate acyltransferase [Rhodobacterales bacterium]
MLIVWAVIGYLLGSIPSGVLIAKAKGLGDLRQVGSGNIGATNVLRTGDKMAAALTLLGDALKGVAAVVVAHVWGGPWAAQIAALAAFVGHCWPVWLGFRGGKGVATYLGILLALCWPVGLAACATWAWTAYVARISSLSALVAAAAAPFYAISVGGWGIVSLLVVLTGLLFWRHAANIARLGEGTEPRIGQ